jgi:ribosomal protein S18 acetylase RimI-like enzyme
VRVHDDCTEAFLRDARREALSTLWDFHVVWHEHTYDVAAIEEGTVVGALRLRIAASLAHVIALIVLPGSRRRGIGRRLLESGAEIANYNNCHKLSVEVPHRSGAQAFFERCGFKEEAILPQHTWKRDVAVMRKFLL